MLPEFVTAPDWPSSSADLNLTDDYAAWRYLESKPCSTPIKIPLMKERFKIADDYLRAAVNTFSEHLRACVEA
ncbi:hypothetical protein HPB49_019599 [Dermacentor silvarum]|uniref:Uncharacterized protein n=1 Tax=Dermacentor silvarum TaxID=543639 RepID=A0ACB8DFL4_DERSI|nr:hypothetical protein HPB49_019599 [Dermacentor silvarum]